MTQAQTDLQTIAPDYSADWIEKLDGRTTLARAVNSRLQQLVTDCGGDRSYMIFSLCKRTVWMEALVEKQEAAAARGEEIDTGRYTQSVNALQGLLRTLGLERRAKPAEDLHEYMRRKATESSGGSQAA
jgi:hypothetical protein